MGAVRADYLLLGGEQLEIVESGGVQWERGRLVAVGPEVEGEYLGPGSVVMPSLANGHTHLEFSGHRGSLRYGEGFVKWLESLIEEREELFHRCQLRCYQAALQELIGSGVTAIGEISSTGEDLKYLKNAPIEVVLYTELLGLNPGAVDFIYRDFLGRLREGEEVAGKNPNLKVGVSIHSPYSVHPKLIEKGLEIARQKGLPVQAHLLESQAEREWLRDGSGEFHRFFRDRFPFAKPHLTPAQFVELFAGLKVAFVHLTYGEREELEQIREIGGGVIHCPISNRLIEGRSFRWEVGAEVGVPIGIGTDGKSSNYTLNLWEEMRVALFIHQQRPLLQLARELLTGAVHWNRRLLGLEGGRLEVGAPADLVVVRLSTRPAELDHLPLQLILQTREVERVYFRGRRLR